MQSPYVHVHLIGLGGIHVSAIAKLLLSMDVTVSGSDLAENELTQELRGRGVDVVIGHAAENIPQTAEAIVFSSAANETNPERVEGKRRNLPAFNSHQFLGLLAKDMKQVIIAGTHGKSTTTAMMGVMFKALDLKPTVVVGTRVPQLADGNLEIGKSDWLIAEGDEFDHHFLAYRPTILVINNIEADHFDVYPTIEDMREAYAALLKQLVPGGTLIVNTDDEQTQHLLAERRSQLYTNNINIIRVGKWEDADIQILDRKVESALQMVRLELIQQCRGVKLMLGVPGEMNARNAAMCFAASCALELPEHEVINALMSFHGIWRRLEKIGEKNGVIVFSDYGHHPTAVMKTLQAVKEFCSDRRIVLCFQPHHRNRTKHLFSEFATCFGLANVVVLSEIYDVKGRDQSMDEDVSSKDLVRAVEEQNAKNTIIQTITYASDPNAALKILQQTLAPNDVLVVMGAGDIYKIAYALV